MAAVATRWLIAGLLLMVLAWGCGGPGHGSRSGSAFKGNASIDEEAYVLPPLSDFEPFPELITQDLTRKCGAAGIALGELRRTRGARRQSILAIFPTPLIEPPARARVLELLQLLSTNFTDPARIVVQFSVAGEKRYYIASSTKLNQVLGRDRKVTLTIDEFWQTMEFEVTPESDDRDGGITTTTES